MPSLDSNIFYQISIWILPVIIAITFHEAAHGFVARKLGDDTAWRAGRVTFNPVKHIDPIGTILFPLMLVLSPIAAPFGWAKAVPINVWNLSAPRRDMILIAAAGPLTNLALAAASALLLLLHQIVIGSTGGWVELNLRTSINFNLVFAILNLIPLPPLDGGRIAVNLLPERLAVPLARLEVHGLFIVIATLVVLPLIGAQFGLNLNVFSWVQIWPVDTAGVLAAAAGAAPSS